MALHATQSTDGTITVALPERFDCTTYEAFHNEVLSRIASSPEPKLCFSFRNTQYIDSAALGMLLLAKDEVLANAGRLQLVGVKGRVSDVLKLAHFERLFSIEWAD